MAKKTRSHFLVLDWGTSLLVIYAPLCLAQPFVGGLERGGSVSEKCTIVFKKKLPHSAGEILGEDNRLSQKLRGGCLLTLILSEFIMQMKNYLKKA